MQRARSQRAAVRASKVCSEVLNELVAAHMTDNELGRICVGADEGHPLATHQDSAWAADVDRGPHLRLAISDPEGVKPFETSAVRRFV